MTVARLDHRQVLERKAEVLRARLFRAVDALDHRRREVAAVGAKVERATASVGAIAAGVAALALVGVGAFALYRAAERRARRGRWRALFAGLAHPRKRRPALVDGLAEKAVSALVTMAVEAGTRRAAGTTG